MPKFLGGKCECPGGCTLSNAGPWEDKELVQKVLAKNKAAKDHANGTTKTPAAEAAAPATEKAFVAAPNAVPAPAASSLAPVPAVEPAAIETPLPEPSAVDKIQQDLANVKMTVVESKVDS